MYGMMLISKMVLIAWYCMFVQETSAGLPVTLITLKQVYWLAEIPYLALFARRC